MSEMFSEDVYKATDFMTLREFYEGLQRDVGVNKDFFMFDYPVPHNQKEYDHAVEFVKSFVIEAKERKQHPVDKETELENLRKVLREHHNDEIGGDLNG
ncbi:hypothetical protein [Lentilactobacillus kosonis]|uniref:Uncharacterized protein n=1 Tax=Lentilactobacillus kosonis TaxID=2810561 RepID=A0A401FPB3_9LACO|nr:hypothetical protein [Lentilactobacillus kosonis]GAY74229.1 hypothetical protein NBRC111893_2375 [Lentilactobacillus kosonis]